MEKKIQITFLVVAVLLPWSNALTTIALIPLGFLLLFFYRRDGFDVDYKSIILIGTLFFVNLIASFFQDNVSYNLFRVIGQVQLLIVPMIILLGNPPISKNLKLKIFLAFAISTLIMAFANYLWAINLAFNDYANFAKAISEVKYDVFSMALIHHHQLYMGMYLSFAAIIFFYYFLENPFKKESYKFLPAIALTIFFIIILSVRMALVATMLSIVFMVIGKNFSLKLKIGSMIGVVILMVLAYAYNPKLQKRVDFIKDFSFEYNYHEDWAYQGLALRLMNWECSFSLASKNLSTGVGIGNVQNELDNCYRDKRFESILWFQENQGTKFNSHNMYIQTLVAAGIFGFLSFTISVFFLFRRAINNRNLLFQIMLFLFCFQGLTESLLYREKGVLLFSFFFSLLLLKTKKIKNNVIS